MAKVLPFQQRSTSVTTPTNEHPAARQDALQNGDLRQSVKLLCHECHYVWWAPRLGKCPRPYCGSERVVKVAEQALDYKRV